MSQYQNIKKRLPQVDPTEPIQDKELIGYRWPIKLSILIPPESNFCIYTTTFCLPPPILILVEIHT